MGADVSHEGLSAAEIERMESAIVDTVEEAIGLALFTCLALLVIWVAFRCDCAARLDLEDVEKQPRDGRTVLFAGSWNPPHLGHAAVLRALASRHAHVVACVGHNPSKTYAVAAERRAQLVRALVAADPKLRGRVTVVVASGLVWRAAKRHGCDALYRGVRSWRQDGAAETWLHVLNLLGPLLLGPLSWPVETRYVVARAEHRGLSSTKARAAVAEHLTLADVVPRAIQADVRELYGGKEAKAC